MERQCLGVSRGGHQLPSEVKCNGGTDGTGCPTSPLLHRGGKHYFPLEGLLGLLEPCSEQCQTECSLCLPPKVVSDHIPLLPPPCQNIDIRPGILLKEATVAEDFEQSDELEMGMSKARWLQLERSVNAISAALALGGLRSLFAANVLLGGGST